MIDELQTIHRPDIDLRWKRITSVRFSRIEFPPEVAYGDPERERRSDFDLVLRADVDGSRALDLGTNAAAFARAVKANLHHLVVESRGQALGHARRVCARKHDIARKDDADHIVVRVGHLLVAEV